MDGFLVFANELIGTILRNAGGFFLSIGSAFLGIFTSFKEYFQISQAYWGGLHGVQKVLMVLLLLMLAAIFLLICYLIFLGIRKGVRHKLRAEDKEDMIAEIGELNRQVAQLVDEKSKILAMKVSQMGLAPGEAPFYDDPAAAGAPGGAVVGAAGGVGSINASTINVNGGSEGQDAVRFPKLAQVDEKFLEQEEVEWDNSITLEGLIEGYRNFACSRLHLYYTPQVVRLFFCSMAASRLLILEGISGTGKTSLPYSVSRYFQHPAGIISVQPSYRDRAELLGYFNEFTKRFNETEFLRHLYEAGYRQDPSFIVLDEMNLARIEYYFAEMLSVLEMPNADEWNVDLVPVQWPSDPKLLHDGKLTVPSSLWFIGTANNDDSTFSITDKVYDRAMAIDLNDRADPFDAPDTPPIHITAEHLFALFAQAKQEHPISEKSLERLGKLDDELQKKFKLAIGNRISKQMQDFIPVYVAAGGTELDALDYIIQRKILKKFESLNISFVRDELGDLITFFDKTFGKTAMPMCKKYLARLQVMF